MATDADVPEIEFETTPPAEPVCVPPPFLPTDTLSRAAAIARALDTPHILPHGVIDVVLRAVSPAPLDPPLHIAVMKKLKWPPVPRVLTVSFMETTSKPLRDMILSHMNAWSAPANGCGISFVWTAGVGDVRISRGGGGYWSYVGTSILSIPRNQQTMNLQGITLKTPDPECRRVIRHEAGHTLGYPHEQNREDVVNLLDPAAVYEEFGRTQGWSRDEVDAQILTPIPESQLIATPADVRSIMMYQFAARLTKNRVMIPGGLDINAADLAFAAEINPKAVAPTPTPTPTVPTPTPTPSGVTVLTFGPLTAEQPVNFNGRLCLHTHEAKDTYTPV